MLLIIELQTQSNLQFIFALSSSLKNGLMNLFLTTEKTAQFFHSLHFLSVASLKEICITLRINQKGRKIDLINQIFSFITTGKLIKNKKIPNNSCAKKGVIYPISPHGLMLKGAYKNDLKHRLFFKALIGNHFHFTAFGIDWLNDRWLAGNPPTYQEFGNMWQNEYEERKKVKAPPKAEWMFIRFCQNLIKQFPNATQREILASWKKEQKRSHDFVWEIVHEYLRASDS